LPEVNVPALVIHPRGVIQPPLDATMELAAELPNAHMLITDGATQLGDPEQGLSAIDSFVAGLPTPSGALIGEVGAGATPRGAEELSAREIEVLRLIAVGKSNQQIADALVISYNTVTRHVTHIFIKTGAANRAEAVDYAYRRGILLPRP
jgi:DNA-binding CsgD family transcriptional regulator